MTSRRPCRGRGLCFSLSLVMAAAALGLGWLSWQSSIVARRLALLTRIESEGGSYCSFGHQPIPGPPEFSLDVRGFEIIRVSFVRRLLGDRAIHCINLPQRFAGRDQVTAAFPEVSDLDEFPHFH